VDISADKRNVQKTKTKNKLAKVKFSLRGLGPRFWNYRGSMQHLRPLISHPGLFAVRIQRTDILGRNDRNHAHFSKSKCIDVLAHITNVWCDTDLTCIIECHRRQLFRGSTNYHQECVGMHATIMIMSWTQTIQRLAYIILLLKLHTELHH